MSKMHGSNNQGIAHLAFKAGARPLCGNRRAMFAVAIENANQWGEVCKRCAAKLAVMRAKVAKA